MGSGWIDDVGSGVRAPDGDESAAPASREVSSDAGALLTERVLLAISALGAGGAERVIICLANHLAERGQRVTLVTFEPPGTAPYYAVDQRVQLRQLGIPSGPMPLRRAWQRLRAVRRVTRELDPDIVVSFLVKINVLMTLATRGLALPLIVSERNNPRQQHVNVLWSWLRLCLYPLAESLVTPSRGVLASFPAIVRQRGEVIPNPVALPPSPVRSDSRTLVAVGRLTPQKGFDLLLHAFSAIAGDRPEWTLVIYGEGEERDKLEGLARALGLEKRVRLPGVTRQPGQWVQDAAIFVLSSRFESFGNVVTEAMAAGLAVVAFDCPWGPGEIVRDEIDGLLVPAEDMAALSDALRRLTGDPELRRRLGEEARVGVQRFDPRQIMGRWEDLIDDVARSARAGSRRGGTARARR